MIILPTCSGSPGFYSPSSEDAIEETQSARRGLARAAESTSADWAQIRRGNVLTVPERHGWGFYLLSLHVHHGLLSV